MDNNTFNIEKALNAVLYIALHVRRSDFHKIFKILYFSDREHLVEYGRAITGDDYYAMEYGPVPTRLYDIFKSVGGKGYYKDDGTFSQYFSVVDNNILKAQKEPDMRTLSKSDVKHLDESIKLYGSLSMAELIEKSHDYAWKSTGYGMEIDLGNIILEAGGDDDFVRFVKENYCAGQLDECEYA